MSISKRLIFILFIIFMVGLFVWLLSIIIPLTQFWLVESASVPRFDALNNSIFIEITVPNGVKEIGRSSSGIKNNSTIHGRYLIINYQMKNNQPDDVIHYYHNLLLLKGWKDQTLNPSEDIFFYSNNSACVNLHVYGIDRKKYTVEIWHDFWKQSFSPPKPNLYILNALELGYTTYGKCPQ
jgi:hypothetical protein